MKNIEKYTNTKDALEAWKKSRWNHKGLFADWLNYEYEAPRVPTLTCGGAMRGIFPMLEDGRLVDIRIRMLKPSELAAAHSFPSDYKLTGNRGDQLKQIGNSVPVMTAAAMCQADFAKVD